MVGIRGSGKYSWQKEQYGPNTETRSTEGHKEKENGDC